MDQYEKNTFDEWLEEETKKELLEDLKDKWQWETEGNAVFISATEKTNIDGLRKSILDKVRALYAIRFPYKSQDFY